MKISVITVCKNPRSGLKRTVESVLSQTYEGIEYIVVDGGSEDGTVEYLEDIKNSLKCNNPLNPLLNNSPSPSLKKRGIRPLPLFVKERVGESCYNGRGELFNYISEPDTGIYNAMNKGIALATGEVINFLNAGDKFSNCNVLEDVAEMFSKDDPDIVYGNVEAVDEVVGKLEIWKGREKYSKYLFFYSSQPHPAIFYKKWLFDKLGNYNEEYDIVGDAELNMRFFLNKSVNKKYSDKTFATFYLGGVSSSSIENKKYKADLLKLRKKSFTKIERTIYGIRMTIYRFRVWLKEKLKKFIGMTCVK